MEWRYLAQRALTWEWLDMDLPLADVELTWSLSGPDSFSAKVSPEVAALKGSDGRPIFDEWSTIVYAEADGIIRLAAILTRIDFSGESLSLEGTGFPGYLKDLPFLGKIEEESIDPLKVVRKIWDHVQAQPDGDLHMRVDGTESPVRIGSKPKHVSFETGEGENVEFDSDERYKLAWYESSDCGDEVDKLAKQCPFDYREKHTWDGDSVEHRLVLSYPRLGRRRDDLRFAVDENIAEMPEFTRDGDEFANEAYGVGKGEGSKAPHVRMPQRDGRLRRCHVTFADSIDSKDRLRKIVRQDLRERSKLTHIESVQVRDHPNAKIGSFDVGDDIRVEGDLPWWPDFSIWCRITEYTMSPEDGNVVELSLKRSDSFSYGEIEV